MLLSGCLDSTTDGFVVESFREKVDCYLMNDMPMSACLDSDTD